jgi:hypothetical protein
MWNVDKWSFGNYLLLASLVFNGILTLRLAFSGLVAKNVDNAFWYMVLASGLAALDIWGWVSLFT